MLKAYLQTLSAQQLYNVMLDLGIEADLPEDASHSERLADILEYVLIDCINEYELVDYLKSAEHLL